MVVLSEVNSYYKKLLILFVLALTVASSVFFVTNHVWKYNCRDTRSPDITLGIREPGYYEQQHCTIYERGFPFKYNKYSNHHSRVGYSKDYGSGFYVEKDYYAINYLLHLLTALAVFKGGGRIMKVRKR